MKISSPLYKKLISYTGVATAMLAANNKVAEAQIIYTDINPDYYHPDITSGLYELDLNNDGITDFEFHVNGFEAPCDSYYVCSWSTNYVIAVGSNAVMKNGEPADNGFLIGSQANWVNNGSIVKQDCTYVFSYGGYCSCSFKGNWKNEETSKFMGLRFVKDNMTFYGWVRLKKFGRYLQDYAFQSIPDSSINAGYIENCDTLKITTLPSDSIHMCIPGQTVILQASSAVTYDINFQWQKNSANIPNATSNTLYVHDPGIYRVTINGYGCTDTSMAVPITYNAVISPAPSITQHLDTLFSTLQSNYLWYYSGLPLPTAVNQFLVIDENGYYECAYIDSLNCVSAISGFYATTCENTHVIINQGNGVLCANDNHVLCSTANPVNITYQWLVDAEPIPGATFSCHTATFPGNITVAIESYAGCRDTSGIYSLIGDTVPIPTISIINDNTLQSSSITGNQWYLNGDPINGANNQTYIASETGDYYVKVTNSNNCSSNSDPVNLNFTGTLDPDTKNDFDAFVVNHQLHIQFPQLPQNSKIVLTDLLGKQVLESVVDNSSMVVNVHYLIDGIYFVIVDDSKSRRVKKVFVGE